MQTGMDAVAMNTLSPKVSGILRHLGLPLAVDDVLERTGVLTLDEFDLLQGQLWEPYNRSQTGRGRTLSLAESTSAPPRVHLYSDRRHLLQPGVSTLFHSREPIEPGAPVYAQLTFEGELIPLIYDYLLRARHAAATVDARQAIEDSELFVSLVPVPQPPLTRSWARGESNHKAAETRARMCEDARNLTELVHLRESTRRRHFVLSLGGCAGGEVGGCPSSGGISEYGLELLWDNFGMDLDGTILMQMPCPSSVKWSARLEALGVTPPWQSAARHPERRDVLLSFIGSSNTPLKARILSYCRSLQNPRLCSSVQFKEGGSDTFINRDGLSVPPNTARGRLEGAAIANPLIAERTRAALSLKRRSIFCLEPPGHAPGRKSQMDAILSGCVPIFFFERPEFESYLPLHFGWREHASVNLEPSRAERMLALHTSGGCGSRGGGGGDRGSGGGGGAGGGGKGRGGGGEGSGGGGGGGGDDEREVDEEGPEGGCGRQGGGSSYSFVHFARALNASGQAASMQRAIAQHAHQLVYSLTEPVGQPGR